MLENIFKDITEDTLVLTVNQRLTLSINRWYNEQQHSCAVWPSINVMPFTEWLAATNQHYIKDQRYCLTALQEGYLWDDIIENQATYALLQPQLTAQLARQTFHLLQEWQVGLDQLNDSDSVEVNSFLQWASLFNDRCKAEEWISSAAYIDLILSALKDKAINLPNTIILYGFDHFSPAQRALINALEMQCNVIIHQEVVDVKSIKKLQLTDSESEIINMARWAKALYEENPNAKIGCVIPELSNNRAIIERSFNCVFDIMLLLPAQQPVKRPFNLSAGKRLDSYPIIHAAINTIELALGLFKYDVLQKVLQSPYNAENEMDIDCGATIDEYAQQTNQPLLSFKMITRIIKEVAPSYSETTWLIRWSSLSSLQHDRPTSLLPSQWAQWILHWLEMSGWPGSRSINSLEFQLIERFKKCLEEWHQLDLVSEEITLNKAIKQLKSHLFSISFQPEGSDAPIQILGVLESSGYCFDHLWVMGLDDEHWPPAAKTNPFLPNSLQRDLNMPHSSATKELEFATTLTERWSSSATHILLSGPSQEGEKSLQLSKIIDNISTTTLDQVKRSNSDYKTHSQATAGCLESFNDDIAHCVTHNELVKGGTWILKEQATCPFKAFAHIRLKATTLIAPELGVSPQTAGTLIHAALEEFWKNIKKHSVLIKLTNKELDIEISKSIDAAFSKQQQPSSIQRPFLEIERLRIKKILLEWMEVEKDRPPFSVISEEERQQIQLNQLKLNVQLDRIDQLESGEYIIIDYKTSLCKTQHWFSSRLEEPQLPLYSLPQTTHREIKAIAFGQLKAGSITLKGVCHEHDDNHDIKIDGITPINKYRYHDTPGQLWENTISSWKANLEAVSDSFYQGIAVAEPLTKQHCRYCDLHTLCRVNQT